jgi:hypothetical protein
MGCSATSLTSSARRTFPRLLAARQVILAPRLVVSQTCRCGLDIDSTQLPAHFRPLLLGFAFVRACQVLVLKNLATANFSVQMPRQFDADTMLKRLDWHSSELA